MEPIPTCPLCGRNLIVVGAADHDTPPWLCVPCHRGWWDTELTSKARHAWDRYHNTYADPSVWDDINQERMSVRGQFTSLRPHHVPYLHPRTAQALLAHPLARHFDPKLREAMEHHAKQLRTEYDKPVRTKKRTR